MKLDALHSGPPSHPPEGAWDTRMLRDSVCPELQPVHVIHSNDWFTMYNRGGYYTLEPNHAQVVILPTVEQQDIVMVQVIRPVIKDTPLELPAGGINLEEEGAVRGAARELAEETGIHIKDQTRFKPLPPLSTSPNRNPFPMFAFHIDLTKEEYEQRKAHDHEVESVLCMPLQEALSKILKGEIYVTVPIAIITRYALKQTQILNAQKGENENTQC